MSTQQDRLGLGERGTRLLASLEAADETLRQDSNPSREVALSACRAADRVERLEHLADSVEPFIESKTGLASHPVFVEVRQQATVMARLITALRLPDGLTGRRPQRRGMRGVQKPTDPRDAKVSSLERARQRSAEGA